MQSGAARCLQRDFDMCQRPWIRPVPRLPLKGVERQLAVELDIPVLDEIERLAFLASR
jgi:hypothetical protein